MSKLETKTNNTPTLRFPEFSVEWDEKKLSELFTEVSDKVRDAKIETYSITAGLGFVTQKSKFGRDISGAQNSNYIKLRENNFSYNKGNSKTYKYGCIYLNDLNRIIAVPNVFISFSLRDDNNIPTFFAKYFEDHRLDRSLKKIISSGARMDGLLNVGKVNFFNINVRFPSPKEQHKIASFLTSIDDWIENLKKQKEAQEKYKKGMMQKIFSQELRFKDENGEDYPKWEEKRLGEMAELFKGEGVSKQDINNKGKYKCIRYGELYTLYSEQIKEVLSRTDIPFKRRSANNDVLMPTSDVTPTGLATASALSEENIILGGDILVIRSKRINNIFFSYYIKANKRDVMRLVNGVTVYHLYGSDMEKMIVKVPRFEEQLKIATFLSSVDDLINLTNQRITLAEKWKKGVMQRMFV